MKKIILYTIYLSFFTFLAGADTSPKVENRYVIDVKKSVINVSVHYAVVPKMEGKFKDFEGTVQFDVAKPQENAVDMVIKTRSISTGNTTWDKLIRSKRLLDAQKYPVMTFKSSALKKTKDGYTVSGLVTLHGVTKKVDFPFQIKKQEKLDGRDYLTAKGTWILNRKDFNVIWHDKLDKGGVVVGDEVTIGWEIFAIKPS